MDHTGKSISEFLLERLKESAALEAAGEAGPPPGAPADQAAARPKIRQGLEPGPDRNAAWRAYAQTAAEESSRVLGSG